VFVALVIQHAPYCHLWLVRLYSIFAQYLINGTFSKKNIYIYIIDQKMCFVLSTKCDWKFSCSDRNSVDRFFGKYSNVEFRENPSSGNRAVPWGRTDRHDEAFRNFANVPKNICNKNQQNSHFLQ